MTTTAHMKQLGMGLGLLMAAPAMAAPVTMPSGSTHELRFDWNADVEDHWLMLAPRMPAIADGTERVARTGLAGVRERQADLRAALTVSGRNAEGGVWARVGGRWGEQDGQDLRLGRLSAPISGLPVIGGSGTEPPVADTDELLAYTVASAGARWAAIYQGMLNSDPDYQALDPTEKAEILDAVLGQHLAAAADHRYDEQITHFNVGVDFLRGHREDGAMLIGAAIGYVRASQEFEDFKYLGLGSKSDWDTVNLGAYASYIRGPAYIDASVSYGWHSMDMDMPILGWQPDGAMLSLDGKTLAAQVEAGWRFDLSDAIYLEPSLAWSWVRSQLDKAQVQRADALTHNGQFNTLDFGKQESQRLGLGAELGHVWALGDKRLTGLFGLRYWNESDAERTVQISTRAERVNLGDPSDARATRVGLPKVTGEAADSYLQATLGARLQNSDGSLSGGLNLDRLSGGDYESWGITASFRYQW